MPADEELITPAAPDDGLGVGVQALLGMVLICVFVLAVFLIFRVMA